MYFKILFVPFLRLNIQIYFVTVPDKKTSCYKNIAYVKVAHEG